MYNFEKQAKTIIEDGKNYGVKIGVSSKNNHLQFQGDFKGSQSVERALARKIATYNTHVRQGL